MQRLTYLFSQYFGVEPIATEAINGSGSARSYFRLRAGDGRTAIGVIGTSLEENDAFFHIARCLHANGINVPTVLAVSADRLCYLQTDLGERSLFDALRTGRDSGGHYDAEQCRLLEHVVRQLPRIQLCCARGMDFSLCYPQPAMDATNVIFDLNYFKYCFLKPSNVDFHELRLERDFQRLAEDILQPTPLPPAFLYRDFQARNIMLGDDDEAWFIDFQGGRRGPVFYDLASFLWQASACYPDALRTNLVAVYLASLREVLCEMCPAADGHSSVAAADGPVLSDDLEAFLCPSSFEACLRRFVLFRLLQVLGAYGFRGYFERKQHFLDSIPQALDSLRDLLADDALLSPYPELRLALGRITGVEDAIMSSWQHSVVMESTSSVAANPVPVKSLHVRVFSFSYKHGLPEDTSGNGGGYVFDCRSTNNPGRYAAYKTLTGLDEPVKRFLEADGEILHFLDSVYPLADFHVRRYLERGFTDLMFSFGCTGGQHRSVYCAQHLAQHLHAKFGIAVTLCHREQGITQDFPPINDTVA